MGRTVCGKVKRAVDIARARNVVGSAEARKEFLCTFRVSNITRTTFACQLAAVLGPVVQPGDGLDKRVLHAYQFP